MLDWEALALPWAAADKESVPVTVPVNLKQEGVCESVAE